MACGGRRLVIWWSLSDPSEKQVEVGPAIEPTVGDDCVNLLRVMDVFERVGVEQHKIGELAGLDAAQGVGHSEDASRVESGGPQGFEGREAGLDQSLELQVETDARNLQRHPNVRCGQQHDTGLVQETNVLQLERDDRPQDRLKFSSRSRGEPFFPTATDISRDESHACMVSKDLLRMHDVVIRHQIGGDRHSVSPVRLDGERARDWIAAVIKGADVPEHG